MNAWRLAISAALLTAPCMAGEIRFDVKPTAVRIGSQIEITFGVSQPTDVEAAVLDNEGTIVRHLAAGWVGGPRAAPPLRASSLTQSIRWDGLNDAGAAVDRPLTVRIRAGLRTKLGRLIGGSPYRGRAAETPYRGSLQGVAVDEEGNVYVKMMSDVGSHGNTGLWPWQLRKFNSQGEYVKTLLPYAPSTDPDKTSGWTLIQSGHDGLTPANQSSLYPVFSVFGSTIYQRIHDGELVFVNSQDRTLTFFKVDGGNAIRQIAMWPKEVEMPAPQWLDFEIAFSPDGRYAYYSNVAGTIYDGKRPEDIHPEWPNGRLYRHDLRRPGSTPEPFYDIPLPDFQQAPYWMPSAWEKRTAAAGIDTDPQGNVYVCDQVNQQVIILSPEGAKLDAVNLPWPDRVQVHPTTGDLYVVSREVTRGYVPPNKLLKIQGRGDEAKIVAELAMTSRGNVEFTLDTQQDSLVLWVLAPSDNPSGQGLLRVEDRGDRFVVTKDIFDRDLDAISFAGNLAVDKEANLVYVTDTRGQVWRYDGETGAGGLTELDATHLAIGPGGTIVCVTGWHSPLARYTRRFQPAPVATDGSETFGHFYGRMGRGCSLGGLTIDQQGRIWTLEEEGGMFVRAYQPDGRLAPSLFTHTAKSGDRTVRATIAGFDIHASCVRADRQGNLYVGWLDLPDGHQPPRGFDEDEAYRRATGSVLKFGPDGGFRRTTESGEAASAETVMGFVGVQEVYPGLAPFSRWCCAGSCVCVKPRFDIDAYGRVFLPNAITFSVTVLDNVGNKLASFGHYGNFDAQGPGGPEPSPECPLGWPTNAGVVGDYVYVADVLNHRVVRVDLDFELQAKITLR